MPFDVAFAHGILIRTASRMRRVRPFAGHVSAGLLRLSAQPRLPITLMRELPFMSPGSQPDIAQRATRRRFDSGQRARARVSRCVGGLWQCQGLRWSDPVRVFARPNTSVPVNDSDARQ